MLDALTLNRTGKTHLHILSRPRRPHRSGQWTSPAAVTFIVTLAATRSVTLAAREARMSRKSAYALRSRDAAFAFAWAAAVNASENARRQERNLSPSKGDKLHEVHEPPIPTSQRNSSPSRIDRERAFAGLIAALRESPPLAHPPPGQ